MARKYITVTLTARVSGDSVVLLDAHGKKIAVVPSSVAECTTNGTIKSIEVKHEWRRAFSGMIGSIHNKRSRILRTPWEIKISTWMKSLRLRRNRPKPYYCKNFRYSDEKRKVWSDAVRCLLSQYNNRLHEHRLRAKSPWRLWAQTVAGNHRKKKSDYADCSIREKKEQGVSHGEATRTKTGKPDVQLQLHWSRNDSCSVVA
jgi:hypothetical protein